MSVITDIFAREVLDSRGNPTIQVEVLTELGGYGSAMVPSGASTGEREALELRDGGTRYGGKGVLKAVSNVNDIIAPAIIGLEITNQVEIDETMIELDGTEFKEKLGANAILGVSMAAAKAAADELGIPLYKYIGGFNATKLPVPMLNIINGGEHADNTIDFQEFMIMPVGATSIREAVHMASRVFHTLKSNLHKAGHSTAVGDEGGFAPNLSSADEALNFICKAIEDAGFKPAKKGPNAIAIALDPACSELYDKKTKKYTLKKALKAGLLSKEEATMSSEEMVSFWEKLVHKYPIISIEDGLSENDWDGFKLMMDRLGDKIQIMGDDLFVTNPKITAEGIKKGVANSILIKVNQIGTLTETLRTMQKAHRAGWTTVVSHRSGETEDTTIADIAVALNTGQIKTGSMSRSDRIAKYNRLMYIEDELGSVAEYDGIASFYNINK